MPTERSVVDVFQDILRNVQEIVRSEVRLAKAEIRDAAIKAAAPTLVLGAGVVAGLFALLFVLLAVVRALATTMPDWAAALLVGVVLAIVAGVMVATGSRRLKHLEGVLVSQAETIKETMEWAQPQRK